MSTDHLTIGKGRISFGIGTSQLRFMGNAPDYTFSVDIETLEHFASTGGLKKKDLDTPLSVSPKIAFTLDEMTDNNMELISLANKTEVTQASGSDATIDIDLKKGCTFFLGKLQVSNVAITGGTSGTDFVVYEKAGVIFIPYGSSLTEESTTVTFDHEALTYTKLNPYQRTENVGSFMFMSDNPVGTDPVVQRFWKVSLKPAGDMAMIGDDILTLAFEGTVLADEANHPTEPYGQILLPQEA